MGKIDEAYDYLNKGGDHQEFLHRLNQAELVIPAESRQAENNLSLYLDQRVIYGSQGIRAADPPRTLLRVKQCQNCHLSYSWKCLCGGVPYDINQYTTIEEARLNACIQHWAKETSLLAEMKEKKRPGHLEMVSRFCVGFNHKLVNLRRDLELGPSGGRIHYQESPEDLKTVKKDLDKIQKDIVETEKKLREMKEREVKLSVDYERLMAFDHK